METPEPQALPTPTESPSPPVSPEKPAYRVTRRGLLRLVGGVIGAGIVAESLRVLAFTNKHTVIPGRVYRTAQLNERQLRDFIAEKGIRTVVNLRGMCSNMGWYLTECGVTHTANVNQEDITLSAKRLPASTEVQRLVEVLDKTAYPIVLHCQRGADRTGLAAVAAKLLQTNAELSEARRQLWPRYGHFNVGRTAVIDQFFDYYETWLTSRGEHHAPDRFRRWVNSEYCPGPYRAAFTLIGPKTVAQGQGFRAIVRAENTSIEPWHFTPGGAGGFQLHYTLANVTGATVYRGVAGFMSRVVKVGESIEFACGLPPLAVGSYTLFADLVDTQPIDLLNSAFVQYGSEILTAPIRVQ